MSNLLAEEQFWSDAWKRHVENYLVAAPRTGYWLETRFPQQRSVLEIAGGSCRDSRYLASVWDRSVGTDFDEKTILYLKNRFPDARHEVRREDGFALSFDDKAFELSFSNGFWVLFPDDEAILNLIREQARVTRKWMVVLVHNDLNEGLKTTFARHTQTDPLYDIRFFTPENVETLIRAAGIPFRSISLEKFGGRVDALYRRPTTLVPNLLYSSAGRIAPRLYRYQSWKHTERVACVVELQ